MHRHGDLAPGLLIRSSARPSRIVVQIERVVPAATSMPCHSRSLTRALEALGGRRAAVVALWEAERRRLGTAISGPGDWRREAGGLAPLCPARPVEMRFAGSAMCFYGARSAWAGMDVVCRCVQYRTGQYVQDSRGLVPEVLYCTSELSHRRLPGRCSLVRGINY
jgi:hypothetical protein